MSEKQPNRLLRQLASAYAFIMDLRRVAIERGDLVYIRKTAGIEARIEQLRKQYPRTFQRYLTLADKRAHSER